MRWFSQTRRGRQRLLLLVLAVALGTLWTVPVAAKMALPAKLQAALFAKIFKYDKQLEGKSPVRVLVAHQGESAASRSIVEALTAAGLAASPVLVEDVPKFIEQADVVYAMPEASAASIGKLCAKSKKLSVSGVTTDAEGGAVSVSLGLKDDGRPEIVVNVTQASAESHSFSSQLLALAKVVR